MGATLLSGVTTVNRHAGTSHPGVLLRNEEEDRVGNVLSLANAVERMQGVDCLPSGVMLLDTGDERGVDVCKYEISHIPHGELAIRRRTYSPGRRR